MPLLERDGGGGGSSQGPVPTVTPSCLWNGAGGGPSQGPVPMVTRSYRWKLGDTVGMGSFGSLPGPRSNANSDLKV